MVDIFSSDTKKKYPLVLINWADSFFLNGWKFITDEDVDRKICTSVGFMKKGRDTVTLYPHIACNDTEDFQGSGIITIPSCSIIKIIKLTGKCNYAMI